MKTAGGASPPGPTPTTHILKPAVAGFDNHDLNEHLCLDAARRCGLLVARTRVEQFAGESAIVVTVTTGSIARARSPGSTKRTSARHSAYRRHGNIKTRADREPKTSHAYCATSCLPGSPTRRWSDSRTP